MPMKHFLVEITYTVPLAQIDAALPRHREFLQRGYDSGLLLMSGPQAPRVGGVVLARAASQAVLERFFDQDPFRAEGLAHYRYVEFSPVKHQGMLAPWCGAAS